jgi:hypothetical protein
MKNNPSQPTEHPAGRARAGLALILALAALSATGCNTMPISQASGPPAALAAAQPAAQSGLSITVAPVRDAATFKTYFGTEKIPSNLLVLFVRARNTSGEADWLLHKAGMRLTSDQSPPVSLLPSGVHRRNKTAESVAVVGAALISLPLLMAGNIAATDATVVQHNFAVRQWRDGTLSNQESREGFLYYQFPEGAQPASKLLLNIDTLNFRTHQTNSFHIPVSL